MINEAQSPEPRDNQRFPENRLRHCWYGPEQYERTSFDEHHEVRQLDEISFERLSRPSTQEKTSLHRHRWKLMHFKETATSA